MAINKVICKGETLMDITSSTVSEDTLLLGETAFDAKGEKITGKLDTSSVAKWFEDPVNNPMVIPEGATTIGSSAFSAAKNVYGLIASKTLETIGSEAFKDCTNLTGSINLKNVKTLGNAAFRGCSKITEVLMDGMEVVGGLAFYYCTALPSITFPGTVTNVQTGAMKNCSALKTITFEKGDLAFPTAGISSDAFVNCPALTDIYVYWASGVVGNAPWSAPTGCKIHYSDTTVTV